MQGIVLVFQLPNYLITRIFPLRLPFCTWYTGGMDTFMVL